VLLVLFFVVSLILSLVLSGALLAALLHSFQINRERKNRRPISYLNPVFLTFVFLLIVIYLALPRMFDLVSILDRAYVIEEVRVDDGELGWNSLQDGERHFTFNPWQFKLEPGRTYRITYTPRSRFIIEASEMAAKSAGVEATPKSMGTIPIQERAATAPAGGLTGTIPASEPAEIG
jgi:hypothetical protein